ncbi:hypothetical protein ACHAXS_009174, partial [Conticribra weissflogii]
ALDILYYAKTGKILDRSATPVVDISSLSSGMFPSIAANIYYSGVLANDGDDDEDENQDVLLSATGTKSSVKESKAKKEYSNKKVMSLKKLVSEALHTSKVPTEEKAVEDGIGAKIKTKSFKDKLTKKMQPRKNLTQNRKEVESLDHFTITSIKQNHDHHLQYDNHSVASSVTMPRELFGSSIHNSRVENSTNAREKAQNELRVFETITKIGNKTYRVRTDDTSTIVTEIADDSKEVVVDSLKPALHTAVNSNDSCMDHEIDKLGDRIAKQPPNDVSDTAASTKNGDFNEENNAIASQISNSNNMTATETTHLATINGTLTPTFMPSMIAASNTNGEARGSEMQAIKKAASFTGPVASFKKKVRAMSPAFGPSQRDVKVDTIDANKKLAETRNSGDVAPAVLKNDASNAEDDSTDEITNDSTRSFDEPNQVDTHDESSDPTSLPALAHNIDKASNEEAKTIKKTESFAGSVSSFKNKVLGIDPAVGSSERDKPPLIKIDSTADTKSKVTVKKFNGNRSIPAVLSMTDASPMSGKEKALPVRAVRSMSPVLGKSVLSLSKTPADNDSGVNKDEMVHGGIKPSSPFNTPSSSKYKSIISCRSMSPSFGGSNARKSVNDAKGNGRRPSIPKFKKMSNTRRNSQNQKVDGDIDVKDCIGSAVSNEVSVTRNYASNDTKGALPPRAPVTNLNSSKVQKRDDGSQAGPTSPESSEVIAESSVKSSASGRKFASERVPTIELEVDDIAEVTKEEKSVQPLYESTPDAPLHLEHDHFEVNISDAEARDVYNSLMISKSSGSSSEDHHSETMNDEVVEIVANEGSIAIDASSSFGISETDSQSQVSLKHIVTVPVTSAKNSVLERLPSVVEEDGSRKLSDDDSLNEILSYPSKKEVSTYSSRLRQINKAKAKQARKKDVAIQSEPTNDVPSKAPVDQIDVNRGDMESVSLLPEIKGLESRKIWDENVTLTPGGEESVPSKGVMGFVCGGKHLPVETDEDESIRYKDTEAKPIQTNRRKFSCFDMEEMQREISEEIKGSLNDIKSSVNSSLRNFVSLFDITSEGGLDVVATECTDAKNNFKNSRLNAPTSNIQNAPKDCTVHTFNDNDVNRKTVTIAEKQVQQQRKQEEVAIQKKRKYLAKLRAVSMKHIE